MGSNPHCSNTGMTFKHIQESYIEVIKHFTRIIIKGSLVPWHPFKIHNEFVMITVTQSCKVRKWGLNNWTLIFDLAFTLYKYVANVLYILAPELDEYTLLDSLWCHHSYISEDMYTNCNHTALQHNVYIFTKKRRKNNAIKAVAIVANFFHWHNNISNNLLSC